ncbi:MAG: DUF4239 domain-containing protein [Candidatus Eremiobacteraeota bacterium]|nr:DUF4239 domain-containing protein [Candidatus Eremiobacteraeota bacterium]
MIEWIESLPTAGAGIVIVGGFVAATLVVGYIIERIAPREIRIEHNDLAGFILAVIGVIYAVLLAFVTIGVWERFQQAEARTYDEAGMLAVIYRDADSFPQRREIRDQVRAYTEAVVSDEWPRMRRGEDSVDADRSLERVDRLVRNLRVTSQSQQDVHDQMLAALNTAQIDRNSRLSEDSTGINGIMWVVLVAGAVITVAFTYLFGFRRNVMQLLMTGALGLLIGLVLFLAVALNYPYRGSITVPPHAFEAALNTYNEIGP